MEIKNKIYNGLLCSVIALGVCTECQATTVAKNTAQMQALDKVTGQIKTIEVPVNGEVKFGSFSVVVRSCLSNPPEETPENYAFVDVADTNRDGRTYNIFKGWMLSSSPSLNSVEHPIYDVWLKECYDSTVKPKLLSEEQLAMRDRLEKIQVADLSKEAQIAITAQEEQARKEEIAKQERAEQEKKEAEAKEEEEARKKAIESELETMPNENIPTMQEPVDGEGPISLLNIRKDDNSSEVKVDTELLKDEVTETYTTTTSENIANETVVDGLVIIEDVHHETVPQELNVPQDIEEIMPTVVIQN